MEPRVINLRSGEPYDLYIGRANSRYRLKASKWANPFKVGRDGTLNDVLQKYLDHVTHSALLNNLEELSGKVLACWCKPNGCHGDILVRLWQWRYHSMQRALDAPGGGLVSETWELEAPTTNQTPNPIAKLPTQTVSDHAE
jgi:hypothetical protein